MLERTIFIVTSDIGAVHVVTDSHNTKDGTLKLIDGAWQQGRLDFDVVAGDPGPVKDTIHVTMRLNITKNEFGLHAGIKSFKGVGVGLPGINDRVDVIEYRIPDYTYTVNIPLTLHGIGTEADKKEAENRKRWRNLVAGLGKYDRRALHDCGLVPEAGWADLWLKAEKAIALQLTLKPPDELDLPPEVTRALKADPTKQPTVEESRAIQKAITRSVLHGIADCLAAHGMGSEARRSVADAFVAFYDSP